MAQTPDKDEPFVPPPPPTRSQPADDSPFDSRVRAEKAEYVKKNSLYALLFAVTGVIICPIVLGVYGFILAGSVLETIQYYNVGHDRKALAVAARIIAGVGVALWGIALIARIFI
jgi:hypothetical protein